MRIASFEEAFHLHGTGRLADAEAMCRTLLQTRDDDPRALGLLGIICQQSGRWGDADAYLRRAANLDRANPVHLHYLGRGLARARRFGDAIEAYRAAVAIRPGSALLHSDLARAYREEGEIELAIGEDQRALSLQTDSRFASDLIYTLHLYPGCDPSTLAQAHANWRRAFAEPLKPLIADHPDDCDPERRLRLGFVLPELGDHPVMRFLLAYLEHADGKRFEFFGYCKAISQDAIATQALPRFAAVRSMIDATDELYARQIREDRIDILFEMSMHTGRNRLLVFARKPAPVQVTWLAYPGTTGLDTIDYRISDPSLDPPGGDESGYSEKTIRLETYWCYRRPAEAPEVGPLPASTSRAVTFGSLNSYSKANAQTLALWAPLFAETPGSRLLLYCPDSYARRRAEEHLGKHGVDPARLECAGPMAPPDYFAAYGKIDIGLDPFPYPGGTTTCDALWMGVPVVGLAGQTAVSRGGKSILSSIGLPGLAAGNEDQYVRNATDLARDLPRLASIRSSLRQRMASSVLMNGPRFAGRFEEVLKEMWHARCEGLSQG